MILWEHLVTPWEAIGHTLGCLLGPWGCTWGPSGCLGDALGGSWCHFGLPWGLFGVSLGSSCVLLVSVLVPLRAHVNRIRPIMRKLRKPYCFF